MKNPNDTAAMTAYADASLEWLRSLRPIVPDSVRADIDVAAQGFEALKADPTFPLRPEVAEKLERSQQAGLRISTMCDTATGGGARGVGEIPVTPVP